MAEENLTLKESIANAETLLNNENENSQNNAQGTENTEQKTDEIVQETKDKGNEESIPDSEITEALAFYNALRDPAQQKEIITGLALRAGLITPDKVALQPKEEKRFGQLLEEILGEEYPDLKTKLNPILSALQKENDDKILFLKQEIDNERNNKAVQEFELEFNSFLKTNKITEDEAGKMLKEIQELPPSVGKNGKRIPLTQYLTKIHKIVASENKVTSNEVKRVEKIQQNIKERATQLSSDVGEDRLRKGSKLPSIKESVNAALNGITFDE